MITAGNRNRIFGSLENFQKILAKLIITCTCKWFKNLFRTHSLNLNASVLILGSLSQILLRVPCSKM